MKVDYVQQMMEVQRGFVAKAEATKPMWQDDVSSRYYSTFVDYYGKYIDNYLQGKDITGMGLEELLNFFEEKAQKMTELTGCPSSAGNCEDGGGDMNVHDQYLNRNMDAFDSDVPNPDFLDTNTVHSIERERSENDRRNENESPFQAFGR